MLKPLQDKVKGSSYNLPMTSYIHSLQHTGLMPFGLHIDADSHLQQQLETHEASAGNLHDSHILRPANLPGSITVIYGC